MNAMNWLASQLAWEQRLIELRLERNGATSVGRRRSAPVRKVETAKAA
jgi:hypothetical protein